MWVGRSSARVTLRAIRTTTRGANTWRIHSVVVERLGDLEIEEMARTLGEIGIGATILALRQVNISRRRIVEQVPEVKPVVDLVLEQVEALAGPASAALGAVVSSIGDAIPGQNGQRLQESGAVVAAAGPELLRLSGLTKRD